MWKNRIGRNVKTAENAKEASCESDARTVTNWSLTPPFQEAPISIYLRSETNKVSVNVI